MNTQKQVISNNPEFSRLIKAVVRNLGKEYIEDVNNHGMAGGFPGFTYYRDTVKFFNSYKKDILALAERMASELGEDMLTMIGSFNCLSSGSYPNRKPDYTPNEIAQAIYSGRGESVDIIKNAMTWFAAEEVCRMFEN